MNIIYVIQMHNGEFLNTISETEGVKTGTTIPKYLNFKTLKEAKSFMSMFKVVAHVNNLISQENLEKTKITKIETIDFEDGEDM